MTRTMMRTLGGLFLAAGLVVVHIGGVPVLGEENPKENSDRSAKTFTGTLKSGFVGIGGERFEAGSPLSDSVASAIPGARLAVAAAI